MFLKRNDDDIRGRRVMLAAAALLLWLAPEPGRAQGADAARLW
jgi:hypothetical protein